MPFCIFCRVTGTYLEKAKMGACDEFARNTLYHLEDAKDVKNLHYVSYFVKYEEGFIACGEWSQHTGHAIVAYQTDESIWRSISYGKDEKLTAGSLNEIVAKSRRKMYGKRPVTHEYAIPISELPRSHLESEVDIDLFPEAFKLRKKFELKRE